MQLGASLDSGNFLGINHKLRGQHGPETGPQEDIGKDL